MCFAYLIEEYRGLPTESQDRIDDLVSLRGLDDHELPGQQRQRMDCARQRVREQDLHRWPQRQHNHLRYCRQGHDDPVGQRVILTLAVQGQRLQGAHFAATPRKDAPTRITSNAKSPFQRQLKHRAAGIANQSDRTVVRESCSYDGRSQWMRVLQGSEQLAVGEVVLQKLAFRKADQKSRRADLVQHRRGGRRRLSWIERVERQTRDRSEFSSIIRAPEAELQRLARVEHQDEAVGRPDGDVVPGSHGRREAGIGSVSRRGHL